MHTSSVLRKLGSWQLSIVSKEERVLTAACLNHETHLGRVKSPQWNISRFMYIYANWTEEAAILPRAEMSDAILRHAPVTRPDAAASPRVRISGSGEMMFSVMGTFSEVHLTSPILHGAPLWLHCVSGRQMDLIADHIRNIFSRQSLVKNQRPWCFPLPINISSAAGPAWWGNDAKGRIYKNLSNI